MHFKKSLIIVLVFISLACSEEELLPEGEINAQKLKEVIRGREVEIFWIFWTDGDRKVDRRFDNPNYSIEGSFIKIDIYHYNLAKLRTITDWDTGANPRIDLEFE